MVLMKFIFGETPSDHMKEDFDAIHNLTRKIGKVSKGAKEEVFFEIMLQHFARLKQISAKNDVL